MVPIGATNEEESAPGVAAPAPLPPPPPPISYSAATAQVYDTQQYAQYWQSPYYGYGGASSSATDGVSMAPNTGPGADVSRGAVSLGAVSRGAVSLGDVSQGGGEDGYHHVPPPPNLYK